jgi:hypothetical protein
MKHGITFEEAFKEQLSSVKPLTESVLAEQSVKVCEISGQPFKAGDIVLTVAIPEVLEGMTLLAHVAKVKKEVIEAKGWTYYPSTIDKMPTVTEESALGVTLDATGKRTNRIDRT